MARIDEEHRADHERERRTRREELEHRELRRAREHDEAHAHGLERISSGLTGDDAEGGADDDRRGEHRPALAERAARRDGRADVGAQRAGSNSARRWPRSTC